MRRMQKSRNIEIGRNIVLLKIYFNSFIPEKYHNIILASDSLQRYEAKVLNYNGKWYILNDRLKTLPSEELENIINNLNSESERLGFAPNALLRERTIFRGATPTTNFFLNKVAEMRGTFVCPICLVGSNDVNIGLEFDDLSLREITDAVLEFVNETELRVDIIKMGNISDTNISSFQYFRKLSNYDLSVSTVISFRIFKYDDCKSFPDEGGKCITLKPKFLGTKNDSEFYNVLIGWIQDFDMSSPLIQKNQTLIDNRKGHSIEIDSNLFPTLEPFLILANEITLPLYLWFNICSYDCFEANFVIPNNDMNLFLKKLGEKEKDISRMGFKIQFTYIGRASDFF